jgi:7-keto-8-aminopelargonate synthetase-like enzyme/acyl-CoA synthetase (AMP-forming)/AMP-acid ligase II/acyl carrier protein
VTTRSLARPWSRVERGGAADLPGRIADRLAAGPDSSVFAFYDRTTRSFREHRQHDVLQRALIVGAHLRAEGLRRADPVVIACPTPEAAWLAFLGVSLAGGLPLVTSARPSPGGGGDDQPARVAEICRLLGSRARVLAQAGATDLPARLAGVGRPVSTIDLDALAAAPVVDVGDIVRPTDADAVAHLQLTSGSTATSRIVAVTHANVVEACGSLAAWIDLDGDEAVTTWLPLNHDLGLVSAALLSLFQGTSLYLLSPFDFLADPAVWLRTIGATNSAWSAAPTFGFEQAVRSIADDALAGVDLSCWRRAGCGGEPVQAGVMERFAERFAPFGFRPEATVPGYGMAETTLAVTLADATRPLSVVRVQRGGLAAGRKVEVVAAGQRSALAEMPPGSPVLELASNGPAVEGTEVYLRDPETGARLAGDDVCGEVMVRGRLVTAGYWRPDGTIRPFPSGTVATGDLGFWHGGELYIVDRLKNVIIRHGENHSAAALEEAVAGLAGLATHRVVVVERDVLEPDSPLVAVIELERGMEPDAVVDRLATAGDVLALPIHVVCFVPRGAIPTTTSGKKRHGELRRRLQEGELTVRQQVLLLDADRPVPDANEPRPGTAGAADPTPVAEVAPALERTVLDAVRASARVRGTEHRVGPGAHLARDLDLDSLAVFDLAVALEDQCAVVLDESVVLAARWVADLVGMVAAAADPGGPERDLRRGTGTVREIVDTIPQTRRVVDRQEGRRVLIDGEWRSDFASCNYLGLDLHTEVRESVAPLVAEWGSHPSWTRAVASPRPYVELEAALAELVGAPDTVVFPTVSLLHLGVLPLLAERGTLVVDRSAHHSIHEAADAARARGVAVVSVPHDDPDAVGRALRRADPSGPKVVAVDGVYSMSGTTPDLARYLDLAEDEDAFVYVDDAHGFGILGRDPDLELPYGRGGGGVAAHQGVRDRWDRLFYVAGLSKALSSMGAFITCPHPAMRNRLTLSSSLVFGGPIPVASLATALAGLRVNRIEGDDRRRQLLALTRRLATGARTLGFDLGNTTDFPIVSVTIGRPAETASACRILWDHGVLITPALFPAVPLDRGGLRFSITAANTEAEVDGAVAALAEVRERVF